MNHIPKSIQDAQSIFDGCTEDLPIMPDVFTPEKRSAVMSATHRHPEIAKKFEVIVAAEAF